MTQEEKQLLLKDLSARLTYGVKVNISASRPDRYDNFVKSVNDATINSIDLNLEKCKFKEFWWDVYAVNVRPYLRPMSSMTEEERAELEHLSEGYFGKALDKQIQESLSSSNRNESEILEYIASSAIVDWLNAHHFDYRFLIPMGLALVAPEGMYK